MVAANLAQRIANAVVCFSYANANAVFVLTCAGSRVIAEWPSPGLHEPLAADPCWGRRARAR